MGQLVSDVTKILEYKESKKSAENERQKILANIGNFLHWPVLWYL